MPAVHKHGPEVRQVAIRQVPDVLGLPGVQGEVLPKSDNGRDKVRADPEDNPEDQ